MDREVTSTSHHRSAHLDWRGRLASTLLGTTGGGLVINILSNDYRWRVVAASLGLGAIVAVAAWLRRRPGTPISRWGIGTMLLAALVATVLAAVGPTSVVPWATGASSALTFGAALVPAGRESAGLLLSASTTIALGTVLSVIGVTALATRNIIPGNFSLGVGAALIAFGMSMLTGGHGYTSIVGLGAAIAAFGLGLSTAGAVLIGIICVAVGAMIGAAGYAGLADRRHWFGVIGLGLAAATATGGVVVLASVSTLVGIALLIASLACATESLSIMIRSPDLFAVAAIALGAALCVTGFGMFLINQRALLIGVAMAGAGVSVGYTGVNVLWQGTTSKRLGAWWARMNIPAAGGHDGS
ncbi:hypothetical protein ACQEUX_30705 [Micromonospora sp. CA-259024]|uniref:hypothetical protein n=1 Tax=Micromonospora sp. CA-259024 TaxID=3239965 RepID=UPI003D8C707A